MKTNRYVYSMSDKNGLVFYVGSTMNPDKRLKQHKVAKTEVSKRLNELSQKDDFTFSILETHDNKLGVSIENKWIYAFSMCGHPLLNKSIKKPLIVTPDAESKKFMTDSQRWRVQKRAKIKKYFFKYSEDPYLTDSFLKRMEDRFSLHKLTIIKMLTQP